MAIARVMVARSDIEGAIKRKRCANGSRLRVRCAEQKASIMKVRGKRLRAGSAATPVDALSIGGVAHRRGTDARDGDAGCQLVALISTRRRPPRQSRPNLQTWRPSLLHAHVPAPNPIVYTSLKQSSLRFCFFVNNTFHRFVCLFFALKRAISIEFNFRAKNTREYFF